MKDRHGYERLGGYKKEDFVKCLPCGDNPDINCRLCGGYGEYPKGLRKRTMWLLKCNSVLK
jgi:hypothetical protein